ncbi:unnamed protein product [Paramecium sonneborni]|uniref:Uncharacterized protein n=1 Tax=Paramecium sonneborni TaxID=65129 RepID=A0A8S1Q1G8_9CILI|nr:unnamed protein product [Paramecium sonneborni]
MDPFFQLKEFIFTVNDLKNNDMGILYGIWSKYNPLGITQQIRLVGLMDSNCFHYFNIRGESGSPYLILYDCLSPEKTIYRFLAYNTADGQQHEQSLKIDPFEYENVWYLFLFQYWYMDNKLEYMIGKNEQAFWHYKILDAHIFQIENLILNVGGGLIVQHSNFKSIEIGSKISYFPGRMYGIQSFMELIELNNFQQNYYLQNYQFFLPSLNCDSNYDNLIQDFNLNFFDIKIYGSQNINSDTFTFVGWFRIKEIHQVDDEFTFQFFKITPNIEIEKFLNPNLAPFQLFYRVSYQNYFIIFTTYSYNFPSVALDFDSSDNNFLLTREFQIHHSIFIWHKLFVSFRSNQILIEIKFYESFQIYEYSYTYNVNQFKNIQFKLLFGNLLKQKNYFNIETRKKIFLNCDDFIEQQNCDYSCEDCDGPTRTNCLSCSILSQRIYLKEQKACICPFNYLDDQINSKCKSNFDQKIQINSLQKENECEFGYFEFEDFCYACPQIISNKLISCLDCIQNVKGWYQNLTCSTTAYIDPNGKTAQTTSYSKQYYSYDGSEFFLCRYCNEQSSFDGSNIYDDFQISQKSFKSFNQFNRDLTDNFDIEKYYECSIELCITCSISITKINCIKCKSNLEIIDGKCILQSSLIKYFKYKDCQTPFYINSKGDCKLCPIQNCKYCFEYIQDDLSKCTLYSDFQKFYIDELVSVGCALCEYDYIFDFTMGKCIYGEPQIRNCLRSYINFQNQEICTLSSTDFNVAPEIINCNKFISNCLQCIFTPQQSIRCIVCQSGYTSSIILGNCYPNQITNSKIVIEGDTLIYDSWVQRVQSFMIKFLPNQYYYQRSYNYIRPIESEVECNDGYRWDPYLNCVKDCAPDCLKCSYSIFQFEFYCELCQLNSYYQPIRSEQLGECFECPELCEVCQQRSIDEIKDLNPMFIIKENNRKYTLKCIKTISNPNVIIDPYYQIAKYCFQYNCKSEFTYESSEKYKKNIKNFDQNFDINYFNQIGIQFFTLLLNEDKVDFDKSFQNYYLTTQLKQDIFSLQIIKLVVNLSQNSITSTEISNFDQIEIYNGIFQIYRNKWFSFYNQKKKINLLFNTILFKESYIQDFTSIFDSEFIGDITFNNIQIKHSKFNNSSLLSVKNQQLIGNLKIFQMIVENCTFINSQFFQFYNNQVQILIEQLVINNCTFINSSLITFIDILSENSFLKINGLIFTSNNVLSSYLLNCTNKLYIEIINFKFEQNQIQLSTIIGFNSNFTLQSTLVNKNTFIQSKFCTNLNLEIKYSIYCQIKNYEANENYFSSSNLFFIESSSYMHFYLRLISIKKNFKLDNQENQVSLFNINCFNLLIENIQIINSDDLNIFYCIQVTNIIASNILYKNLKINNKMPFNIYCQELVTLKNQLFLIIGYNNIIIRSVEVIQQFTIDSSIIEINSDHRFSSSLKKKIELIDFKFIGNSLQKRFQYIYISLITILTEQLTEIYLRDLLFQENSFHQYTNDALKSSGSLIQIIQNVGQIQINNLYCQYNMLTNSMISFLALKSETIKIQNFTVKNHNKLPLELWQLYYDLQTENLKKEQNQEYVNSLIQQTFQIKSKCAAAEIIASQFSCFNCLFEDIIGLKSSVFQIETFLEGIIQFQNLTINSSEYDLSQSIESSGSITIDSSISLLKLSILNANFINVFNRMAVAILTIIPSNQSNYVIIQNITITNCISLKNSIIIIQFSSQNIDQNKVVIQNVKILYQEEEWINYFGKTGMLKDSEITDITDISNSLMQFKNCKLILQNLHISGFFSFPLIRLINISKLLITQLWIFQIQQFYPFNLLEFHQDQSIDQILQIKLVYFQQVSDYKISQNRIFSNSKYNYGFARCLLVESKIQKPIIYDFESIIKLMQLIEGSTSLIEFKSNSNQTTVYLQNMFILLNNCYYCSQGLLYINFENQNLINIRDIFCYSNNINNYGCINIVTASINNHNILIKNSDFLYNNGTSGVAIFSQNISIQINQCKILKNIASYQGGGLYLNLNNKNFLIKKSIIINNFAQEGGGIYFYENGNIDQDNFVQSFLQFNKAHIFGNNLVEFPTHIDLFINFQEMQSQELEFENITIRSLKLNPYKIIEQGISKKSYYLMLPSYQVAKDYQIFIPQKQLLKKIFNQFQLQLKNIRNEVLFNIQNFSCQISQNIAEQNKFNLLNEFKTMINIDTNTENNSYDLGSIKFHFNPYQDNKYIQQLFVSCSKPNSKRKLQYLINTKSFKCQLGEFFVEGGCQKCESTYGFYSVTYNATKCSIFDKTKFADITSNSIQLLKGYWRPDFQSDYFDVCFKNMKFCEGGWKVGNDLCSLGHLGGLCEECDNHNIRGQGKFFKDQQDSKCYDCVDSAHYITGILAACIWAIFSILLTLKSIEKSTLLFNSLKIGQKHSKILFKLNQDLESILIKMLLNYFWIFSVIFTFNIQFSISFSFVDQTSNTSNFIAFNLDCFLSDLSQIEIIYTRIITTLVLIFFQFVIITFGYIIYSFVTNKKFDNSVISNTLLYLYVSNYSGLIKQFGSILSMRIISNIDYIQGDVKLKFGSQDHVSWIYYFAIPGIVIFGLFIPFLLFFLMLIKKGKLDKIKLRRHICYLFNEYNDQSYFWELIKFSKKTIIILLLTVFESNILFKATLLGLCLLIYQIFSDQQQPYIISSLNKLDLSTGQICSFAIFIATSLYLSEQEKIENLITNLLQILIVLLSIRLIYPFVLNIVKVYYKKYKVTLLKLLYIILHYIIPTSQLTKYLKQKLNSWEIKENKLKQHFILLKEYLLAISKSQIQYQRSQNSQNKKPQRWNKQILKSFFNEQT